MKGELNVALIDSQGASTLHEERCYILVLTYRCLYTGLSLSPHMRYKRGTGMAARLWVCFSHERGALRSPLRGEPRSLTHSPCGGI